MHSRITEVALSVALVSITFYLLWPVGDVQWQWWRVLPETLRGDGPLLALLLASSTGVGVAVVKLTPLHIENLVIRGCIAYILSMGAIEVVFSPDSPVHWVLYGVLLVGILLGGSLVRQLGTPGRSDVGDGNSV